MDMERPVTYCCPETLGEDAEEDLTMSTVDYRFIDADQHTYEPGDCFSRHIEAKFRNRTIELGAPDPDGHRPFVLDGKRILPNFADSIMGPGTWREALSLEGTQGFWCDEKEIVSTAEHPEYRDRNARLAWMDAHNVEACILNCTLPPDLLWGSGDMELHYAHLRSFNRHLEEDWGFDHEGRIFAAGNMALDDLDMAVAELERLAEAGTRFLNFPPRPPLGGRSPADPYFDPFWARLAETDIVPMVHLGDGGGIGGSAVYGFGGERDDALHGTGVWGEGSERVRLMNNGDPGVTAFQHAMAYGDRPIMDFLTALILHNLFGRFPNLQLLVTEYGTMWVPLLLRLMDKGYRLGYGMEWLGGRPDDLPSEIFKRHISITPFYGDDIPRIMDLLGPDRVLLGSDWPHPEGVFEPADFLDQLPGRSEAEVRGFMRDNGTRVFGLSPSGESR